MEKSTNTQIKPTKHQFVMFLFIASIAFLITSCFPTSTIAATKSNFKSKYKIENPMYVKPAVARMKVNMGILGLILGSPYGNQSFDRIAGTTDIHGDRPTAAPKYILQKNLNILTPKGDKLRDRINKKRVADQLKAIQQLTQSDRIAAQEQAAEAAAAEQSDGCFPADMQIVLADGQIKKISGIVPGDMVLTYDLGREAIIGKPVVEIYSVTSNHLYTINDALKTTGGERMLTPSGWRVVSELTKSEQIHVNGKMETVREITQSRLDLTTYNLQVADTHNFYVATPDGDLYLVHNSDGGGGK